MPFAAGLHKKTAPVLSIPGPPLGRYFGRFENEPLLLNLTPPKQFQSSLVFAGGEMSAVAVIWNLLGY